MSLYFDAVSVLSSTTQTGSLKSRIYGKDADLKSKPAHIYALISETAKFDGFLKEVIDNAGIIALETKLTPLLTLLLVHDHFFAKSGIAAASTHPIRLAIERHKARLQSECTKARLRRKCATVDALKKLLVLEKGHTGRVQPRWARINSVKTKYGEYIATHLSSYNNAESIPEVLTENKVFYIDQHIPQLLAFAPREDLTKTKAYKDGEIILQDKASCFPAHLLLGGESVENIGNVIDGCAAPGNKTTHLAAILTERQSDSQIFACERDPTRSMTLKKMVNVAGAATVVEVLARQDFLALQPSEERFANVTHLLLDPSCSGSGIIGREDVPVLTLPEDRQSGSSNKTRTNGGGPQAKKRKREADTKPEQIPDVQLDPGDEEVVQPVDRSRLEKLSGLQSLIVEHAMSFPAACKIAYSTCSIHVEENEQVVSRVLQSKVARNRGWRVLRREEQVEGMKLWKHRGTDGNHNLRAEETEACIRCVPGDDEGTMGFFVCGFVRNVELNGIQHNGVSLAEVEVQRKDAEGPEDDWSGFSDAD